MRILIRVELEERYLDQIRRVSPHLALQSAHSETEMRRFLADIEVLATDSAILFDLHEAPALKWVQWWGAGVDSLLGKPIMRSDIVLTTVSGIEIPMAEYVVSQMVSLSRGFPQMMFNQMQHRWGREDLVTPARPELGGKKLGVVGYGRVGHEIARVALCLGMEVMATRRSVARPLWDGQVEVLPAGELIKLLRASDFVILCAPLTLETKGLIGERELRAMKPTSYLINVARGEIVEELALTRALREAWIAGAALDVFAQEPLPPSSDLWDLPNVIITPHISGYTEVHNERATALFCENLRRYLAGEELLYVVDKVLGY